MKLRVLCLTGALIAAALPLSARADPFRRITGQPPALSKPRRLHTPAHPVITGTRTVMPRTASSGGRIAQSAGE